ncbi:MAG: glycosyltransferase [Melioribacteraceae bacterium]|nr:glycosyltransferase [Bacteroidales bacterium]MCF8298704.1 glycosyltransferase [Saprospiraceae bacterium]MCF8395954.1 glycosyltransferase [Melioribacteraceae bacterium]
MNNRSKLSFIIIGRNEGWKLTKCLKSVFKTIKENNLSESEVIYVDSKSSDNSITRAKQFKEVKLFQISGQCNAAIGRNIGAKESTGDTLFFIDGDMEIQSDFLPMVYSEMHGLKYSFVSGQWINFNYSSDGSLISKEEFLSENYIDEKKFTTGGLFLIKRDIWDSVNGMKTKMRRSQDLDIALRLAKNGIFLYRKKELLAIHHTIPYTEKTRIWKMLFSGDQLYRIVLLRENFLNKYEWKIFLRGNYTFIILLLSILFSIIFNNLLLLFIYLGAVITRTLLRKERNLRLFLTNIIYFPIYELALFIALFMFLPKNKELKYYKVQ